MNEHVDPDTGEIAAAPAVPTDDDFGEGEYLDAPAVGEIAGGLISRYVELAFLADWKVAFLWKRQAPKGEGKETLGRCKKVSKELGHWVKADWVIWIAADAVRDEVWSLTKLEALIYHELKHCSTSGKGARTKPCVRGHDVEMFFGEVQRFGFWNNGLSQAKAVFGQAKLPFEAEAEPRAVREAAEAFRDRLADRGLELESIGASEGGRVIKIRERAAETGEGAGR